MNASATKRPALMIARPGARRGWRGVCGLILCTTMWIYVGDEVGAENWKSLADDSVHDGQNPDIGLLQEPREALSVLPPDTAGNKVDWIRAFSGGYIKPRSQVTADDKVEVLDLDIIMNQQGSLPRVLFPHKPHTQWLDCANCHDDIFEKQAGATPVTMSAILEGEYCGVCHGAVAFPLTECSRCHSQPNH